MYLINKNNKTNKKMRYHFFTITSYFRRWLRCKIVNELVHHSSLKIIVISTSSIIPSENIIQTNCLFNDYFLELFILTNSWCVRGKNRHFLLKTYFFNKVTNVFSLCWKATSDIKSFDRKFIFLLKIKETNLIFIN